MAEYIFKLGADIFSPSHTWPHQHSPASLMMQTPEPQQRLSGVFIIKPCHSRWQIDGLYPDGGPHHCAQQSRHLEEWQ